MSEAVAGRCVDAAAAGATPGSRISSEQGRFISSVPMP